MFEILKIQNTEFEVKYDYPFNQYLEKHQGGRKFPPLTSLCWRGYTGNWLLKDNCLFMTGLKARRQSGEFVGLDFFFPNVEMQEAFWYTGKMSFGVGKVFDKTRRIEDRRQQINVELYFEDGVWKDSKLHFNDQNDESIAYLKNYSINKEDDIFILVGLLNNDEIGEEEERD